MFSGKSSFVESRHLSSFFTLRIKDLEAIFPVNKFDYSSFFFLSSDARLEHPVRQFRYQYSLKTQRTVSSRTLLSIEFGISTISSVSRRENWVFPPALPFNFDNPLYKFVVNSPNDSNICFKLF